jgi:alpha-tubulin suppressor-like RCC1 family protein
MIPAQTPHAACLPGQNCFNPTFGSGFACSILNGVRNIDCWGDNRFGQIDAESRSDQLTIRRVWDQQENGRPVSMAVGGSHVCVVFSGRIVCWGSNSSGQLGRAPNRSKNGPEVVPGMERDVLSVAAAGNHTCAIKANGSVWCWGENRSGQIGDGTTDSRHEPIQVWPN